LLVKTETTSEENFSFNDKTGRPSHNKKRLRDYKDVFYRIKAGLLQWKNASYVIGRFN